jgi:ribosomal-protein-serine acetyltransferase
MITDFPIVIDAHTKLTLLSLEHAEEFFALIEKNRPYLRKWLGWLDNIQKIENLKRFIQSAINDYPDKKSLRAWIRHHGKIVGIIHLVEIDWFCRKAMIGYWIDEKSAGKGLATKACEALTQFAFNEWKLNRVEIRCAPDNIASQMIPNKLGFKEEGVLRSNEWLYDHFIDHIVYSKLANETKA